MRIAVNNVHLDLGAGRRGTDMGPSAMYVAGLMARLEHIGHEVQSIESVGNFLMEAHDVGDPTARYLNVVLEVCTALKKEVFRQLNEGYFPLTLGGDHSQAIGSISGAAEFMKSTGKPLGVLWFDAHADMNTPETTPSGNIHGMPLAVLTGRGHSALLKLVGDEPALDPANVVIFAARDVDPQEADIVQESGVGVYAMSEIDYRGMRTCLDEAIERVTANTGGVHLSFDLDGVDPAQAPGVGTPVPGGMTLRESHLVCERVCASGKLVSMEMVELNPTLDTQNKTAKLAVWLIESALGRSILYGRAFRGK
jgi:arginase